ncbi:MAG: pyridine nucleotide-disulfide oxidoreductase, partial [Acidiphilium sp. 21-68-69]
MAEIVVLGAGLGGTLAAFETAAQIRPEDRITLIGERNMFQFTPSNPWVAVGWRDRAEIEVSLDKVMRRKNITLRTEGAARVHPAENRVELNGGESIPYDYLIIATGPELAFDEIPGCGPAQNTVSICQTDHAAAAFEAFERFCANPGPVVVGAVQGASCFGPAYEFAFILDRELRKRRLRSKVPMTFVTSEPYIGHLGLDGVGDTKSLMESELRHRHIKWITNAKIAAVDADKVVAEEVGNDGQTIATHELPSRFTMFLPAFRGVPALRGIEGLVNPRGFVLIDEHQRNPAYPNVFSVGVCVAIPP